MKLNLRVLAVTVMIATAMIGGLGASHWRRERSLNRPSALKATLERGVGQSEFCRPVKENHSLPLVGDPHDSAAVSGLLATCGPAAVLGAVRTIIVDPFDAVVRRWASAHVGAEVLERLPALADDDPALTVVPIRPVVRVGAALKHAQPDLELGTFALTVRGKPRARSLTMEAAARFGLSALQTGAGESLDGSAVAPTDPARTSARSGAIRSRDNNQPAEPLPRRQLDKLTAHRDHSSVSPRTLARRGGHSDVRIIPATRRAA